MDQILTWLIDSSIIAGFIILIIMVMRPLIKKLPKWVNLVLWMVVAVRLVMPVGIESSFSLVPDIGGLQEEYSKFIFGEMDRDDEPGEVYASINDDSRSSFDSMSDSGMIVKSENTVNFKVKNTVNGDNAIPKEASSDLDDIENIQNLYDFRDKNGFQINETARVNEDRVETGKSYDLVHIIGIIWLVGCGLMLIYFIYSIVRIRRSIRISVPAELPFNLKTKSLVPIYVCEGIKSPFIMGLVGTRLYIPEGMSESTLEYVIKHENAHIRHFDQLWKVFGFVLLMLYWFNPLVWLAFICFSKDLELACDERAAGKMSPEERVGYSEALLECSIHNRLLTVCPVAFGETGVKDRVKAVIGMKKPLKIVIACIVFGCSVFGLCFLTNPASGKGDETDDKQAVDMEQEMPDTIKSDDESVPDIIKSGENTDIKQGGDRNQDKNIDDPGKAGMSGKNKTSESTDSPKENKAPGVSEVTDTQEMSGIVKSGDESVPGIIESGKNTDIKQGEDRTQDENIDDSGETDILGNDKIGDNIDDSGEMGIPGNEKTGKDTGDSEIKMPEAADIPEISDITGPYEESKIEPGDETDTSVAQQLPSDETAIIPYGIKTIKKKAFSDTLTIKSATLPDTVETIGDLAFIGCSNLESIELPASLTSIGAEAFGKCALKSVIIPDSVTDIGKSAFCNNWKLEYCKVSENHTKLADWIFAYDENLKKVDLSSRLTKIGEGAFFHCTSLEKIDIPKSVVEIGSSAFACTALKEIRIPEGVEVIRWGAFQECTNLERIYLPESLKTIEGYAFNKCVNLKEVYLPDSVETIGECAFANCSKLQKINIPDSVTTIDKYAFWQSVQLSEDSVAMIKSVNNKVKFGRR